MKTLIDLRDPSDLKVYDQIERSIQQKTQGGIRRVMYEGRSYIVRGGFRNNLFIVVSK